MDSKTLKIIDDYAHDFKDIDLDELGLSVMLKHFANELNGGCVDNKSMLPKKIKFIKPYFEFKVGDIVELNYCHLYSQVVARQGLEAGCAIPVEEDCNHIYKCEKCGIKTWEESYTMGDTVWKPQNNERYFIITSTGKVKPSTWNSQSHDLARWESSNCYKTEAEAKKHQKLVLEAYKSL